MTVPQPTLACLLVHGLNGSPYDFEDIAMHLQHHNIATDNILLPGHNIHHRIAAKYGWPDWLVALKERFDALSARYGRVAIVGHSMGGALALTLAAHDRRVTAIASLCAPVMLHPFMSSLADTRMVVPYIPLIREDISERKERQSYRTHKVTQWAAVAPMQSLLKALPQLRRDVEQVSCPTLVLAARNDHVVPVRDGYYIYQHLASAEKKLVILNHSWHVVTRDIERHKVTDSVLTFLIGIRDRHALSIPAASREQ